MNIEKATTLLQLISDASRLTIIKELQKQKKMIASDLLKYIDCGQSTLSHHMTLLTDSELVKARKKGNKVYYSLNVDLFMSVMNFLTKDISKSNSFILEKNEMLEELFENPKEEKTRNDVPIYLL